jgi:hypothetical protein
MSVRRRNRQQWSELLVEFSSSNQTVDAFCSERGMSPSYFLKKRTHLRRQKKLPFVRAKVAVSAEPVTVQIQDVQIRCTASLSPVWLAELAVALRR